MSRRDSTLKAVAAALQPKNLDLTKFRQRSTEERTRSMSAEQAAGAMGFVAMNWLEDPDDKEAKPGDPLPPMLIRLKYAEQREADLFSRAHRLLVKRHTSKEHGRRRPSNTLHAVALAALFEWVHDHCPRCRGSRGGVPNTIPCPACAPSQEKVYEDGTTHVFNRLRAVSLGGKDTKARQPGPDPACAKCLGLGKLFKVPRKGKGIQCIPCGHSGRRTFTTRERWRLAGAEVVKHQKAELAAWKRARGPGRAPQVCGMSFDAFTPWVKFYNAFMEILRKADKRLHVGIDTQIVQMENADTVPGRYEELKAPSDESYFPVGQTLQGGLPPKEP